ncbi:hypothetical protein PF005_g22399 [Phytophthora fragariae]|uniref:Uncharacterized protein n=1 Tax=Phytophthora fragariae TaxID=53985 RepID=A0A6A3WMJ8_9STRA|nr:hypothetical protein PF011_g20886 [Phytophthora fragariae]KAE9182651.1 hypothetical protein PF005_g22399 [Phytophthora fragariae]KAE9288616.1 hypothetical protein PF001_g20437 [Phytophthora fragariae]
MGCVGWERRVRELRDIVAITVWDDSTAFRQRKIDFRPGAVYVLHQVEYLGFHDGIANGTVRYEVNNAYKIRELLSVLLGGGSAKQKMVAPTHPQGVVFQEAASWPMKR